ncbi:MAG: hypothetical protein M1542_06695 [Thermotogae bacterium]|nr:hypothetical protein [Thermotogota bacterium]
MRGHVYLACISVTDMFYGMDGISILAKFKDRIGLREFVEKMRISYYLALFKLELIPSDMD